MFRPAGQEEIVIMPRHAGTPRLADLPTHDDKGDLNVIVETPRGSGAKYDYDEEQGLFKLGGMLPKGSDFPFNFGFAPGTEGEDGDPLDVLILMEEPAFSGCLVTCRLIGVIEAEQTEDDGTTERNDRLIAVAAHSREHADVDSLKKLPKPLIEEIEHFFVSYNQERGKRFKPLGYHGAKRGGKLVEAGVRRRRKTARKAAAK
jgi:inorganic pyrophosphatase